MESEIQNLYNQLDINNKRVLRKANEYLLRLRVKRPGGIGGSESCKPAACLYIACKDLLIPFDKVKILNYIGKTDTLFHNAVTSIFTILEIKRHATVSQLNDKLKLNSDIVQESENLLEIFKNKLLGGIQEVQKKFVDLDNGLFAAACICVMANQHSIVIDNSILVNQLDCSHDELQRAVNSIVEHCYKGNEHIKLKKTPPKSSLKNSPLKLINGSIQISLPKKPVGKLKLDVDNNNNSSSNNKDLENKNNININKDNSNNKHINNCNSININNKDNSNINNKDSESTTCNTNNGDNNNNNNNNSNNKELNDLNSIKTNSILSKRSREDKKEENNGIVPDGANQKNKYILNDGDLTMEEERKNIKKKKEEDYKQWVSSDFVQNNVKQVSKPTKQLTLDSFFK